MKEPLIQRIRNLMCRLFGHRFETGYWYHADHEHAVCSRCNRIISTPLNLDDY